MTVAEPDEQNKLQVRPCVSSSKHYTIKPKYLEQRIRQNNHFSSNTLLGTAGPHCAAANPSCPPTTGAARSDYSIDR